jgi:hypothetical protein
MVEDLTMKDEKKVLELENPTVYQTNENCQVFTGPISGCVFAMPGATVNQSPVQQIDADKQIEQKAEPATAPLCDEELFKFIHPALSGEEERSVHEQVKKLVTRQGIQEICKYLTKLESEEKIYLPQSADTAYTELVRMGMPNGDGFSIKTFMKYYKK